ncbi:MAG: hypothetical protein JRE28_02400 [Deltaproteobacteria bacterium]|nr:hypothetical protein [Deltaproteobacteria bacterium]
MAAQLKRTYFYLLIPSISVFIAVFFSRRFNLMDPYVHEVPDILPPILFILSVVFAVALPILYRALFANRMRHRNSTPETDWLKFEHNLIRIALVTPYLTVFAHFLQIPKFHLSGTTLATLYAIYYFYPSQKRIAFEKRIFRVKQ